MLYSCIHVAKVGVRGLIDEFSMQVCVCVCVCVAPSVIQQPVQLSDILTPQVQHRSLVLFAGYLLPVV